METSRMVNTILNCFVDMNLETNERFPYDIQLMAVTLSGNYFVVNEDSVLTIDISIDEESTNGIEELDLILSHTTTNIEDIGDIQFPIHLKWEIGERTKTVSIPISMDFIQEEDEQLVIGMTNLVNLKPGTIMQASVIIVDTTVLRTVRITESRTNADVRTPSTTSNSTRGNGNGRGAQIVTTTSYFLTEGEQITITIGLDSPSEYGIEKVNVSISNSQIVSGIENNTSILLSSGLLEWSVGEQYKTVTISTGRDGILQGDRRMILELSNPLGVILHPEQNVIDLTIQDPPVARRYTTLNFGRIFKQRGSQISNLNLSQEQYLHLKVISDTHQTRSSSLYWLVELGSIYSDIDDTTQSTYTFGVDEQGRPEGVELKVTNTGSGAITYGGNSYNVGESFFVVLERGATTITLPSNDGYQPSGTILSQDNTFLSEDTFTLSKYKFEMIVDIPPVHIQSSEQTYGAHGFVLKTESSDPNTYFIGDFELQNYSSPNEAFDEPLGLYSSYSRIRTRYNGSTCTNSFDSQNNVRDAMIHGIIFLSQNSLNTDYVAHNILPMNGRASVCGITSGVEGGSTWISIPFENN